MALGNTYNTTEENLLAGILEGLGGSVAKVGNDQVNTKNDLLKAILNHLENNGTGSSTGVTKISIPTPEVGIFASYHTHQFSPKGKSNYDIANDNNQNKNGYQLGPLIYSNSNPKISVSFTEKNADFLSHNPVIEIGYFRNRKNGNSNTQHNGKPVKRFVHPGDTTKILHPNSKYRVGTLQFKALPLQSEWNLTINEEYNKQIIEIDMNGFVEGIGANDFYGKPNKINFPFFGKKQPTKMQKDSLCFKGRNTSGRLIIAFRFRINNPDNVTYTTSEWSQSIVIDVCYEKAKLTGLIPLYNEGFLLDGTIMKGELNYVATGWRARLHDVVT